MSTTTNVNNISVGKPNINGAVYRAPLGTTLPTSADATLGSAFKGMGYISADGLTNTNNASTSSIKAWGGDTVLVSQTDKTDTFQFTLLESLNTDVLGAIFGTNNVSGTLESGITVDVNVEQQAEASWVIDMVLKGNIAKRIVIPDAAISALADVVYKDDTAIGFGVTISALPDSDGNTHYEYIKKASTT